VYRSAAQAYEAGSKTASSGRELEAAVLSKAARQIEACQVNWDAPDRPGRLRDALRYNTRLWTIFQVEMGREDSPLPVDLRLRILQISAFVDRRTLELYAKPSPDKLQALIAINRELAAGLSAPIPPDGAQSPPANSDYSSPGGGRQSK
jgi:flagellar protein FlaF